MQHYHDTMEPLYSHVKIHKKGKIQSIYKKYKLSTKYDFVIVEGFLNALKDREEVLRKICKLIKPGGFGIVTEDDRYGCFVECIKQITLKRICELLKINFHSDFHEKENIIRKINEFPTIIWINLHFAESVRKIHFTKPVF